jgi:phosphate-selective porin OprO/OprP
MTKLSLFAILLLTFFSAIIRADEADDKLKALEKRCESLEQRYRALEEKIATLEKGQPQPAQQPLTNPAATLSIGPSGFMMRSADTNFSLRVRGLLQTDSRSYLDDGGVEDNDTFLLRRARLIFQGTVFRDFDFLLVPDFGGTSSPSIRDAWLQYRYAPPLQLARMVLAPTRRPMR